MRIAFRMTVAPEHAAEYETRHRPIWPELEQTLLAHGVRTYSIFLERATGDLFAYAEVDSLSAWEAVAETEVCRRWWRYMAPLMTVNDDLSPTTRALDEVFHIEADPAR
ncbi:MAG: L-rhamnose mutarotase [Gemmatimonadetes bacterium]|nr:L-rhamnose mutarotase [Gemmatimonadota bacterium]